MMKCLGTGVLEQEDREDEKKAVETFLKLLAPFAPHMAEELWREHLGHSESIHTVAWPAYDSEKIKEKRVTIAVQVNGKVRDEFEAAADAEERAVKEEALARPRIQKWIEGKSPRRVIYVSGKLINIVVEE